jgi:hypothetical protein
MTSERGLPPPSNDDMDEERQRRPSTWVRRVRVVRDTQLGKGFAYVQFTVSTQTKK